MNNSIHGKIYSAFRNRLSLKDDNADDEAIDLELRAGVELRGSNLWLLMFAIFIASIGLNVNSTAVIIGAMLISPLMGPIMGIGYGVGVLDFPLMRRALKNLGIAVLISLLTSTLYFLITPLQVAQSELLARTSPTIWDVVIALFGGFAGIIGATRNEKRNVIPGVAIATALMPPLCTASYGLANGNWSFFFGAFYLFTINSVCIAFSAAVVTRAFHVRQRRFIDVKVAQSVRLYVAAVVVLTVLPSIYLAIALVREEVFSSHAQQFVKQELKFKQAYVSDIQIDRKERSIDVTLIGEFVPHPQLASIRERLSDAGLNGTKLEFHQAGQRNVDVSALKSGILSDLYAQSTLSGEKKDKEIQDLREQLKMQADGKAQLTRVPDELHALFPNITKVWLSTAIEWDASSDSRETTLLVNIATATRMSNKDKKRIESWLHTRLKSDRVKLVIETIVVNRTGKS